MGIIEDRQKYYKLHDIDFSFIYHDHNLMRIPFERPHITRPDSLDYYIFSVRKLYNNIIKAIGDGDNDYFARTALQEFNSMFTGDWRGRLKNLEEFIEKYNKRISCHELVKRFVDEEQVKA